MNNMNSVHPVFRYKHHSIGKRANLMASMQSHAAFTASNTRIAQNFTWATNNFIKNVKRIYSILLYPYSYSMLRKKI